MMKYSILFLVTLSFFIPSIVWAQSSHEIQSGNFGQSPFQREHYGDVKFLDAYFGTSDKKTEIDPGDQNVPFTVVFANVGTDTIAGIKGQLSLPIGFSSADGSDSLIIADSDSNSLAGANFYMTFYVNIDKNIRIQQYPGTVKVDYSRLRESGIRTTFSDFNFKITGDSVINVKAIDPFLTSLKSNNVVINISNDGTAPISSVHITSVNTGTTTPTASTTNVIILESDWNVGNIGPKSSKYFSANVYVPENLREDTLQIPLSISYNNAHGDLKTISKIVDLYIKGLIDLTMYDIKVIQLSGTQMVVGQIINEGNQNALFGFITLEPLDNSNIKKQTQFIDQIETNSPVPFNIPIEFDGEPRYGEHDIKLTVRYKDSVRDEIFLVHNATILVKEPPKTESGNNLPLIIIPIVIVAAIGIYIIRKRKKSKIQTS